MSEEEKRLESLKLALAMPRKAMSASFVVETARKFYGFLNDATLMRERKEPKND